MPGAAPPAAKPAAAKQAASGQPPLPSMAAVKQAQQLTKQLGQQATGANNGKRAGGSTSAAPGQALGGQPPMPSMAAAHDAQAAAAGALGKSAMPSQPASGIHHFISIAPPRPCLVNKTKSGSPVFATFHTFWGILTIIFQQTLCLLQHILCLVGTFYGFTPSYAVSLLALQHPHEIRAST